MAVLASRGTLVGKVHQGYSPAPSTRACLGFEENALDLDGFQDAGFAWVVATACAEVKWCCQSGWVSEAGGGQMVCGEGRVVREAYSRHLDELVWRVARLLSLPKVSGF